MKGLIDRSEAHGAAQRAVVYWQGKFAERKEAYIIRQAARSRGFFDPRPRGRDVAERLFETSVMEGGVSHGAFWREKDSLDLATALVRRTAPEEIKTVLLDGREIDAIRPGMRLFDAGTDTMTKEASE